MFYKKQIFLFFLLIGNFCFSNEVASPVVTVYDSPQENEEALGLEYLIEVTKENLKGQMALKDLIANYQKEEAIFLENPKNQEQLFKTAKSAKLALDAIKEQHLTQVFDAKFLGGLNLFAKFAGRPSVPKPY